MKKKKFIRKIYAYVSLMSIIGTVIYFIKGVYIISKALYYLINMPLDNSIDSILTGFLNIIISSLLALLWLMLNSEYDRKE